MDDLALDFGEIDVSGTGAKSAVMGGFWTVSPSAAATLTLAWGTWTHQPVSGDLLVAVSSAPLVSVPPGWIQATEQAAYATFYPGMPDPVFSASPAQEWHMGGYIAYPKTDPEAGTSCSPTL